MKHVFFICYGQCDEDIESSLAEDPTFKHVNEDKDLMRLYKILQNVNFSYKSNQEPILTMWNVKRDYMNLCQQKHQSVQEYYEQLMVLLDVNKTLNTNIHDDLGFIDAITRENGEDPDALTENEKTNYTEQGRERMMAMHMLMGDDRDRFGRAIEDFECSYLMDHRNSCHKTLHDCYTLLKGWRMSVGLKQHPMKLGVLFKSVDDDDGEGTSLVNWGNK
jgi:hypothetical protein